jgi:hypothetical protein
MFHVFSCTLVYYYHFRNVLCMALVCVSRGNVLVCGTTIQVVGWYVKCVWIVSHVIWLAG